MATLFTSTTRFRFDIYEETVTLWLCSNCAVTFSDKSVIFRLERLWHF